jgi:hypothetical protein
MGASTRLLHMPALTVASAESSPIPVPTACRETVIAVWSSPLTWSIALDAATGAYDCARPLVFPGAKSGPVS